MKHNGFNLRDSYRGFAKVGYLAARAGVVACRSLPGQILKVQSFSFEGRKYKYCTHRYNHSWSTERTVEIPIIRSEIELAAGKRVLEVGNVLSHYQRINHLVIDKYEKSPYCNNVDIIEFNPGLKFDVIVSISTLEHVGWDEVPKEPEKILRAIEHLRSLLAPGGKLVATVPVGYNDSLDKLLKADKVFDREGFLKRTSVFNTWQEVSRSVLENAHYNFPFPGANVVLLGTLSK
jgi:hypothetical protein